MVLTPKRKISQTAPGIKNQTRAHLCSKEFRTCGEFLCPIWTEEIKSYWSHYLVTSDFLHTDECDLAADNPARGVDPANYIVGPPGNNPNLRVTLDFGFQVVINGVFLKNSHNDYAWNWYDFYFFADRYRGMVVDYPHCIG